MKEELDKALVRDFPLLYGDRYESMRNTCMCWGFDVGDSWEPLIRELSEKLEPLIQKYIDENELTCRWCGQKEEGHDKGYEVPGKFTDSGKDEHKHCHNPDNRKFEPEYPRASQVKEKFGTLCFYMTSATTEMYDLIHECERRSSEICETCGAQGELRTHRYWRVTLCDSCSEKRDERDAGRAVPE